MATAEDIAQKFGFKVEKKPTSTVLLGGPKLAAAHERAVTAAFVEAEHPRDPGGAEGGQFIEKGSTAADEGETKVTKKLPFADTMTRLHEFTADDVRAGKVPGLVEGELREEVAAHAREDAITVAKGENGRGVYLENGKLDTLLIAHEAGHTVANEIQREEGVMSIPELEPFRKDPGYEIQKDLGGGRLRVKTKEGVEQVIYAKPPSYENPFGANNDPSEILADTYSELLHAGEYEEPDSEFVKPRKALLDRVAKTAAKLGLPSKRTYKFTPEGSSLVGAFVEAEHPRHPAGSSKGGEFARKPGRGYGLGREYKLKETQLPGRRGGVEQVPRYDQATREVLHGTRDTQQLYRDEKSRYGYTPARVRDFQDPAIATILADGKPQAEPVTLFMAGGSGSGKSTVLDKMKLAPPDSVVINPDEIKEMMPEYKQLIADGSKHAAEVTHEESSDISKRALGQAVGRDYNVVLDGTGNSGIGKFMSKIEAQKKFGRKVKVVMVDIPTAEAIRRADARAAETGRFIDHGEITKIHKQVNRNHLSWRNSVDDWEVYTNDAGPKLVARRVDGGKIEVLDEKLYKRVLDKGK